ncbi:MAG TPA: hypothetical protein VIZ43_17005 [Trebonia sp.]
MASGLTGPAPRPLRCHPANGALIIGRDAPSDAARALAANLAADDEHVRVIVDLPADVDGQLGALVQDVLPVLAADPRTPRLIPSSQGLGRTTGIGRLIAEALGRTVLAHHGAVVAASRGALFVPPAAGPGWVRLQPGEPGQGEPLSPRFPAPRWSRLVALDQPAGLSAATIARPLPGGSWLHEPRGDGTLRPVGQWLAANLAWADDQIFVVLGHPGAPPVPAADIARFWETIPAPARDLVRFVPFAGAAPSGQELADALGEPVTFMAGVPVAGRGRAAATSVRVLGDGGRLGEAAQVAEVRAEPQPRARQPSAVSPERFRSAPLSSATAPPSIVLESGPAEITKPSAMLAMTAGPAAVPHLIPSYSDEEAVRDDRQSTGTIHGTGGDGDGPAAGPVHVQPVPGPATTLAAPARGLTQERQWLHRTLGAEFDAAASAVTRVLAQTPGLRVSRDQAPETLADLVAAWLYLSGRGQRIDEAARTGEVGAHVPFGRCAAEGLRRLPSYRGPARLRAALGEAEWRWYGSRTLVTEWAFCPALIHDARLPGTVDFLIWSATARRADLLAPGGGRVVFLPGTRFRVLRARDGQRREVFLRELAPGEIGEDGEVDVIASFDELAVAGLERAGAAWLGNGGGQELAGEWAGHFGSPPGLVVADAGRAVTLSGVPA